MPAGPQLYVAHGFDADISAFVGQYVMLEFSSDGDTPGFAAGDWLDPRIVAQ